MFVSKLSMFCIVVESLMLWHIVRFVMRTQLLIFVLHNRFTLSIDFWLEVVLTLLCEIFDLLSLCSFLLIFFPNLDEAILWLILTELETKRHSVAMS